MVLDLGVILGHYCSDMTRTVYLGQGTEARSWLVQAVQEAQAAGVAAVKSRSNLRSRWTGRPEKSSRKAD